MTGLFDDLPEAPKPEAPKPRVSPPPPTATPEPAREKPVAPRKPPPPRAGKESPCPSQRTAAGYVCRVGGGDAGFTDDHGRSWFCMLHRPSDFLPGDRR